MTSNPTFLAATNHPGERVTTTIIEAVADAVGADPRELRPPLYDVVDPEAIEALCAHAGDRSVPGSIRFGWCSHLVDVSFDGEVSVDRLGLRGGDGV